MEASSRVLQQANAAVDRELRSEALAELCLRVDDWKNHDIAHFGDLLLHGQFTVVTGKSDVEKEVYYNPYPHHRRALLTVWIVLNISFRTHPALLQGGQSKQIKG
jgi:hypothetical protein